MFLLSVAHTVSAIEVKCLKEPTTTDLYSSQVSSLILTTLRNSVDYLAGSWNLFLLEISSHSLIVFTLGQLIAQLADLMLSIQNLDLRTTLLHFLLLYKCLLGIRSWKVVRMDILQYTTLFPRSVQSTSYHLVGHCPIPGSMVVTVLTLFHLIFTNEGEETGSRESQRLAKVTQLVSGSVEIQAHVYLNSRPMLSHSVLGNEAICF